MFKKGEEKHENDEKKDETHPSWTLEMKNTITEKKDWKELIIGTLQQKRSMNVKYDTHKPSKFKHTEEKNQ